MTHEKSIIEAFIHPEQKARFTALLSNPKNRDKFIGYIAHKLNFDSRYASKVPANQQNLENIEKVLKAKGARNNCFAISENSSIDGKELNLHEALQETVGCGMGTILSIIPGRLAYFEGEDIGERYILFNTAT